MRARRDAWVIVLASASRGDRSALVRPTTFRCLAGQRSVLEHTWIRARRVAETDRIVTVVADHDLPHLGALGFPAPGRVASPPTGCGSATAIYLAAAAVFEAEPEATVHILPAAQFIHPNAGFADHLRATEALIESEPEKLVLTAAAPDAPEADLSWIEPGETLPWGGGGARRVGSIYRCATGSEARRRHLAGCLWQTGIVSGRASTLWQLGASFLPETLWALDGLRRAVGDRAAPSRVARRACAPLPRRSFCSDLLAPAVAHCLMLRLTGVAWSDWQRPHRVAASVERFGLPVAAARRWGADAGPLPKSLRLRPTRP